MLAVAVASATRGGAPVRVADGAEGMRRFLTHRVRLPSFERDFEIHNASGLGEINRLSSDHVLKILRFAQAHEDTRPLLDALASPGKAGTLRSRLVGTEAEGRLFAKTGTEGNALALSGYVKGRGRKADLGFSVLAAGASEADRPDVARWIDAFAITMAKLEPRATPARGPPPARPAVPHGRRELELTFGRPGEHVVRHRLKLGPGGKPLTVRVNKKLVGVLETALADADRQGLLQHIRRLGGTYKLRTQRRPDGRELEPRVYSTHSYGIAFDLNPDARGGDVHPALAAVLMQHGFVWGAHFARNYDPMHFQFVTGF
jgi:hypothetical protein